VRIAIADPPYPGQAKKHYGDHPDYAGEVNHLHLLHELDRDYDGWALHTSSVALADVLQKARLCRIEDYRIMAWVKPFAAFKRNVPVAYAWEPVLVKPCRKPVVTHEITMRDWYAEGITMQRGLAGAKPRKVCEWLFHVLGAQPDDELVDLFPGTGAVTDAWEHWRSRPPLSAAFDVEPAELSLEAL
jgi:hypothetical protein